MPSAIMVNHFVQAAVIADVEHAYATTPPLHHIVQWRNDKYNMKYFAMMVRYWDDRSKKTHSAMLVCNVATGQTFCNALLSIVFSECGIPLSNVVSFCSDSAVSWFGYDIQCLVAC